MRLSIFICVFVLGCSQRNQDAAIVDQPAPSVTTVLPLEKFIKHLGLDSFGPQVNSAELSRGYAFDAEKNEYYITYATSSNFGGLFAGGARDSGIMKMNRRGEIVWKKLLNDGVNAAGTEWFSTVKENVFKDGFIYTAMSVTGNYLETHGGGMNDIVLLKISAIDGHVVWQKQFGQTTMRQLASRKGYYSGAASSESESISKVIIENNKLYFIGATTSDFSGKASGQDILIIESDLDGNILKIKQFNAQIYASELMNLYKNGHMDRNEFVTDAVLNKGKIFITGSTTSNLADTISGVSDVYVVRLNANTLVADKVFQLGMKTAAASMSQYPYHDASGNDSASGVAVDAQNGNVFLTGMTNGDLADQSCGGFDLFVLRLTADLIFEKIYQAGMTTQSSLGCASNESAKDIGIVGERLYIGGTSNSHIDRKKVGIDTDPFFLSLDKDFNLLSKKQIVSGDEGYGVIDTSGNEAMDGLHIRSNGLFVLLNSQSPSHYLETSGLQDIILINMGLDFKLN